MNVLPLSWAGVQHERDDSRRMVGSGDHGRRRQLQVLVRRSQRSALAIVPLVVTRTGRVGNRYKRFPSFSHLSRKEDRKDFLPSWVSAPRSMDFDLKRRPVMCSMTAAAVPLPDGSRHEMATFTTEPWDTVEECLQARLIARELAKTGCLRTVDEWHAWHVKFSHGKGRRIVTAQRSILMSIVMAHRQGILNILVLADRSSPVADKLAWLGQWGLGTVSEGDWKNARRSERTSQLLPLNALSPYLDRMLTMAVGVSPDDADRSRINQDPDHLSVVAVSAGSAPCIH